MIRLVVVSCIVLLQGGLSFAILAAQSIDRGIAGYVIKRWTNEEGLPHNSILSLAQTRDGYLWIGTTRGGLVRFDGVTFTTFNVLNTPGLPSNWISALHEDRDGTLWIGTDAGLLRFQDGVVSPVVIAADGDQKGIVDIRAGEDGRLWVAGHERVFRRAGDDWEQIPLDPADVRRLAPAPDGAMWIATSAGLFEWRDVVRRRMSTADGLPSDDVRSLLRDRQGRLWIGTSRGLASLDAGAVRADVHRDVPATTAVYALLEDSRGVLWAGAIGQLFVRPPDRGWSRSILSAAAESAEVRVFAEDRGGHIWFGIAGGMGGLHRLTLNRVETTAHQQGLPCDNVGAVTEGPDGTIWLSTFCSDGRGVVSIRGDDLTSHPGPAYVTSMLAEADGGVWAGTSSGQLYRREVDRFLEADTPTREIQAEIAAIYRHHDGTLWLGTSEGLFSRRRGEWTRYGVADGLVSDDVRSIAGDADGALWIGTNSSISRLRDGRFESYGTADGVPVGPVRAIHADAEGAVWIGAYGGGLARLKNGKVTAYGTRGGLLDTSIHRIFEDERAFLWLTGDHGIRRASKRDLNALADGGAQTIDIALVNEADGMRSEECNGMAQPAGWRLRDGTFYIPTQRGLVHLDPSRVLRTASPVVNPTIEDVIVDGTPAPMGAGDLPVPAGSRDIEFRYTAPAFRRPELMQFRYWLEGHNADWIEVGTRRTVSFANLRPGRYRLLVAARHSGGAWSKEPATVSIVLEPFLYQRTAFQIVVGLLVLAGGLATNRWYVRRLRRRSETLQRAVAERTAELTAAHDHLSTTHDDLVKAKQEVDLAHGQVLAVLGQLDMGVVALSESGLVTYASPSAFRLLGRTDEVIGRPWSACLPLVAADRDQLKKRLEQSGPLDERVPVQMVIGGRRYWIEIDLRDEPPPGNGRIFYWYNVTEVSPLPAGELADSPHGLVGRSTAMQLVFRQIGDVAGVDCTVLIEGETGVGKELVARAIHRASRRAGKPFIAVNAAGLSESLLASQLFGHRRGAFTGAVADHAGVFEAAHGGTLFLDEVGDMSPGVQASLLRVLQEREITRIGESHARRIDVRFLAATHRDLAREVREGRFREDLVYRIRVARLTVPPLRARIDDVPLLVESFLQQWAQQTGRARPELSRDAVDALMRHRWPGNVRELRAVIERSLVNARGDIIRIDDLPDEIRAQETFSQSDGPEVPHDDERARLLDAVRRAGGNRSEAARLLGMSRRTFYRRLAEYELDAR